MLVGSYELQVLKYTHLHVQLQHYSKLNYFDLILFYFLDSSIFAEDLFACVPFSIEFLRNENPYEIKKRHEIGGKPSLIHV